MTRHYSIKRRVLRSISEILLGTVINVLVLFFLTYLLVITGQLNSYGSEFKVKIKDNASAKMIAKQLNQTTFDYVVFEKSSGKISTSRYQSEDYKHYKDAFDHGRTEEVGTIRYAKFSNSKYVLILRCPTLPEFVNPRLRQISFNSFSYLFFLILELALIIWSISRLLKEFTKNFRLIQEISLTMGKPEMTVKHSQTEMIEFNDILSMLYQKDAELVTLLEAERKAKKDLSFQVAALAHDIKTPLTVLKGNLELLDMTELTNQQSDFLNSADNSIKVFEKYFNDMIQYSRLLVEEKDYQEEIFLPEFLEELDTEARAIMDTHEAEFNVIKRVNLEFFKGNQLNLSRALINILSNAARYSSGHKKVTLSVIEEEEFLVFHIWNNGPAFTKEALESADNLFYTENKGRNSKHYGIGLSFAQAVAKKHHGKLVLQNPPTGGAVVSLSIKK
ncbi:Signal transduction histidine kinase [Streptococcus equinus]|uniref:histidine kinase n=1 Tax=Streptococcus equinus TaxID=1335 RepID=A0A1H0K4T2_STREI|nr:HAMP domain-containing sensor histidine kinase [Streptococcus equinus]SDO51108.1 Signal transduction histidine kinase [Streptococcus equinus]